MDINSVTNEDFRVVYLIHSNLGVIAGVTIGEQPTIPEDSVIHNVSVVRLHFPMSMHVCPDNPEDDQSQLTCQFIPMLIAEKPLDIPITGGVITGWGMLPDKWHDLYLTELNKGIKSAKVL